MSSMSCENGNILTPRGVLVLFTVVLLVYAGNAGKLSMPASSAVEVAALDHKSVMQWTTNDVEVWLNMTIGYPEYSAFVRKHRIDGLTLLEMEPADFESFWPITTPLHVIKIKAHTKMLRGLCSCADSDGPVDASLHDFWGYLKAHNVRTLFIGSTALFFPRLAMAGTYAFDRNMYLDVVGTSMTQADILHSQGTEQEDLRRVSWVSSFFYWLSFFVAPDLYLAYQCARFVPVNYFLMPCFVLHFIFHAYNEYLLLYMIYSKTAFEPGVGILKRIWVLFSYTLFFPPAALVAAYVLPTVVHYVLVVGLVLHTFMMIAGLLFLVMHEMENASGTSGASGEGGSAPSCDINEREGMNKLD